MSVEFVKDRKGANHLREAYDQQLQLSYFTQSKIQPEITTAYLEQWTKRNYRGNDYFLNWVKMIFRTQNFISFFKYLRYPLSSAKLINDEIKPRLKRVYFADEVSFIQFFTKNRFVQFQQLTHGKFLR